MTDNAKSQAMTLLETNETYARQFQRKDLPSRPSRKVAVVTCMDARMDPLAMLGARLGDMHVIRNAGGRVTDDVIRSLVISQQLLGTEEVLVIHHTDCGMMTFKNEDMVERLAATLGSDAAAAAETMDFLPFPDLAESVKEDVQKLKQSPLIPDHIRIFGGIYDVRSGKIDLVD